MSMVMPAVVSELGVAREPSPARSAGEGIGPPEPGQVYESHFGFVWRNLRRLGVADAQLEDAAQDVFLTVHRRWETYDAQRSSLETWLFGILLRVARNHRRSLRRRLARLVPWSERHTLGTVPPSVDGPAELVAQRQAAALLDRLLDSLDDDKRAILVLVELEQVSVPQAAETLGLNVNTAYWRLGAARRSFQSALERVRAAERRRMGGIFP
jgi:RNA polymerase sigma-70 factor (ECF subfamily)